MAKADKAASEAEVKVEAPAEQEAEAKVEATAEQEAEVKVEATAKKMVTAIVPKNYRLMLDNHSVIEIKAGTQEMEESIAKHWYSIANGVKIIPVPQGST